MKINKPPTKKNAIYLIETRGLQYTIQTYTIPKTWIEEHIDSLITAEWYKLYLKGKYL